MGLYDDNKYVMQMQEEFKEVAKSNPDLDLIADAIKRGDKDFYTQNWSGIIAQQWGNLTPQQTEILNKG